MTAVRLRPRHSDAELARIYAKPHNHLQWRDHHLRIGVTTAVAQWMSAGGVGSAADLSCGNGAVLKQTVAGKKHYGDYAPGYQYTGPIESTIDHLPRVDFFICCETLEHLDDPATVLRQIRGKASMLLLSTPVDNWGDSNEEHYWAWSQEDVTGLLKDAGWDPWIYIHADPRPHEGPYKYGIWGCR